MKLKHFFLIFVFMGLFLLGGCDESNENTSTENQTTTTSQDEQITHQENYILYIGDELNPFKKIPDGIITYESKNPDILSVDAKGNIKALSKGSTSIFVYKDSNLYGTAYFEVQEKASITKEDTDNLFDELFNKIASYDTYNSFIFTTAESENAILYKTSKNPLHIEEIIGSGVNQSFNIYEMINGNYYVSNINEISKTITTTQMDETTATEKMKLSVASVLGINPLELKTYEISKDNYKYNLRIPLSDFKSIPDQISQAYGPEFPEALLDTVLDFDFYLVEKEIYIVLSFTLHYIEDDYVLHIPFSYHYNFDFQSFTFFSSEGYSYNLAKSLNSAVLQDLSVIEHGGYGQTYYYGGTLKKGRYAIQADSSSFMSELQYKIYDSDKKEANLKEGFDDSLYLEGMFTIPEDGVYYFGITCGAGEKSHFYIVPIEDHNREVLPLEDSTGSIYDKYDYQTYTYESSDKNEIIKITNNGDELLFLYCDSLKTNLPYNYPEYLIKPGEYKYINPNDGKVDIHIISGQEYVDAAKAAYNYSFHVDILTNDNGTDLDNLDYLTEEYDKEYFVGLGMETRYIKLKVEKEGYYNIKPSTTAFIYIDGKEQKEFGFYLTPGEYTVKLYYSTSHFFITQIKYTFIDVSDKEVDVTLPIYGRSHLRQQKVLDTQIIKYRFSLAEDSLISFDTGKIQIFDEEDNALTIKGLGLQIITKLKAGNYYFIDFVSASNSVNLPIGIVEIELEEYFELNSDKALEFNYEYIFNTNLMSIYRYKYRVFESDTEMDIKITGINSYILSEDGIGIRHQNTTDGSWIYHLEANTKYYFFLNSDFEILTVTIIE